MSAQWRYRGREISSEDVASIRRLIAEHPGASRRALSAKLCDAWQWQQANGAPRDMVCRGLLLMLHRAGEIELPPVRYTPPNPLVRRARPRAMLIDTTPIHSPLSHLQPVGFQQVRRTADEPLFNSLMECEVSARLRNAPPRPSSAICYARPRDMGRSPETV